MTLSPPLVNVLTMASWTSVLTTIAILVFATAKPELIYARIETLRSKSSRPRPPRTERPDPRRLFSRILLNLGAMLTWSAGAEIAFRAIGVAPGEPVSTCWMAIAIGLLAYLSDSRYGSEMRDRDRLRIVSPGSLPMLHTVFAVGLAIGGLQRV